MNNILHSNYWSAMKIEGPSPRRHWLKTHLYAGLFLGKIERSSSVAFTEKLILYCSDDPFSRLRFLISHKKQGKNLYLANFGMLSWLAIILASREIRGTTLSTLFGGVVKWDWNLGNLKYDEPMQDLKWNGRIFTKYLYKNRRKKSEVSFKGTVVERGS